MTTLPHRTLRIGGTSYPLVLPSIRDSRLHLAAVIVTIHVLGQVVLGFRVSVPQIIVAIATCAVIEVAVTFERERRVVWPASAMLTGSGVALILRVVGMGRGDHWSWRGWYLFAAIAGLSLLSKFVIRRRGAHLFNPSNLGLVVAFVVLGSDVVEPLDFWWAPMGVPMALVYLVILAGGLAITSRLGLFPMALVFWGTFAALLGVLTASGHCLTTAWSVTPVCGSSFWWVVVTSPEVLIFLFFMITDPKTIPSGRAARLVFGAAVAVLSTTLIAPQSQEFGAKVGLLAGLVILTPFSAAFDRLLPERTGARMRRDSPRALAMFGRGVLVGVLGVAIPAGIVVAGSPAREGAEAAALGIEDVAAGDIQIGRLPKATVDPEADALSGSATDHPDELAAALARALAIEAEAMRRGDASMLRAADDGPRLIEMERAIEAAATAKRLEVVTHEFATLRLVVVYVDGPQGGANLAFEATGSAMTTVIDPSGAELESRRGPFERVFVLRPTGTGIGWVIWTAGPLDEDDEGTTAGRSAT